MSCSAQNSITKYFPSVSSPPSAHEICASIVTDILKTAIDSVLPGRCHQGDSVKKDTLKKWECMFPWLLIEQDINQNLRMKCKLCTKYNIKTVWATEGTPNIQKSTIDKHNDSVDHSKSRKLSLQEESFDSIYDTACIEKESLTEEPPPDADQMLIRTVYTLMKSDICLEKVNTLLTLQKLNGLDIEYKNLSWTSISDIRDCIAKVLVKTLTEKINKSEYYALLIDETTDITISKRLSICVRYLDAGTPQTSFLGNVELPDGRAHTITEALNEFLKGSAINTEKCISLATDGASVMMGHKSGVGVQFKSKYAPFVIQTHCVAHRLNLAITDSIKEIDQLKKFQEKFSNLYNYMSGSANRVYKFKKMQSLLDEPELTIKEPYSIRWLGLRNAVEAVYESYGALLATLSEMASSNSTAKGLYKYFSTYKTALLLGLMIDVHSELAILSCQLQEQNIIFSAIAPKIDSVVGKLELMKTCDAEGLGDMKRSITIKEGKAFYKGDELQNYSNDVDTQFEKVKTEYLNNLIKNIKKRIRKHDNEILKCLSDIFQPQIALNMSKDELNQTLEILGEEYGSKKTINIVHGDMISGYTENITTVEPLITRCDLSKEWKSLHGMIKGSYKGYSLNKLCQALIIHHYKLLPNLAKLAKIAVCIEVTSVECERSFSAQNRIKTKFRSSLKDNALVSLLVANMLGPDCKTYDPKPATHLWLKVKSRRKKRLMQDYAPRETHYKKKKTC